MLADTLLLIVGLGIAMKRRLEDVGLRTTQRFGFDLVPLVLLFAIAITGLALTASATWWQGRFYWFISLTHQVLVVAWLLSIPFGKFFHIFQRPASMGVTLYQTVNQEQEAAAGVVEVRGSHCALRLGPPVEAVHRGPQGDARRSWAEV